MRLNLYSLQLFVAVVDEGTIAAAAERQAIAASALSKRISELERSVGAPLLIRQARGVVPTATGQVLARRARKLLHDADDLSVEVCNFATGMAGHVRIAANLSAITQGLPADLNRFLQVHPKVQIDLEETVSSAVTRMVQDNAADIGIFASADDEHLLRTFPYREDRMVLVVPASHPLARHAAVAFADTLDLDHIGMRRGSASDRLIAAAASAAGRGVSLRYHVTSFDALISMVRAGMGVGMMPHDAIALYDTRGLCVVGLEDPWALRRTKLCVRPEMDLTAAGRSLLEHLRLSAQS